MNAVDSVPLDDEAVTNAFTDFDVIDMRVQNDLSIRIDEDAVTSVEQVNTVYNRDRSDGDQIVLNPAMAGMIAAMAYAGRIYEDGDLVPLRAVDPTGTYWFVVRAQFNASLRDPDGERNYRSVPESVAAELISDVDYERLGLNETLGPRNSATPAVPSASSHQEEPVSAEDPPDRPGEPIAPPSVSPFSAQESAWNDGRSDPASVSPASSSVVDDSPGGSWGGWSASQDESSTVPVPVAPAGGSGGAGAWSVPVSEDPRSPARFQSSQSAQSVWSAPSAQSAPAGPVPDGREPVVPWGSDSAVSGPEAGGGSEDAVPTAPVSVRSVSDQGGVGAQTPTYGVNGPSHAQVPAQPFAHPPSQGSGGNPFPPPETRQETTQGRPPSTPQGYWPQPVPAAQWDNIPVLAQGPGGAQETPPPRRLRRPPFRRDRYSQPSPAPYLRDRSAKETSCPTSQGRKNRRAAAESRGSPVAQSCTQEEPPQGSLLRPWRPGLSRDVSPHPRRRRPPAPPARLLKGLAPKADPSPCRRRLLPNPSLRKPFGLRGSRNPPRPSPSAPVSWY